MARRKESSSLSRVKVKPAQSKDEKVSSCPSIATRPHKGNCRFELPPPTSGHPPELFVETGESPIKKKQISSLAVKPPAAVAGASVAVVAAVAAAAAAVAAVAGAPAVVAATSLRVKKKIRNRK